MIKSMTGYGRVKKLINGRDIIVEIRSVNSRFLDTTVRLNRMYSPFEDKLKQLVSEYISRGKIEIYTSVDNISGDKVELTLNKEYIEGYIKALKTIVDDYNVPGEITLSMLASKPDAFNLKKLDEDMNEIWEAVKEVAAASFNEFDRMREIEGQNLKVDLIERIKIVEQISLKIFELSPKSVEAHNQKLRERVRTLLEGAEVDEARLLAECAILADKLDITEELVRLKSHIDQLKTILEEDNPTGRKLDFLLQEINREVNTCGSKANDIEIAKLVVDAKSELERIREQIQNIE
ncbi:MAG: YicC family protein [Clostridiales bacterium GWF2_38_85]|nr:MAG: YicC family protein [Clostridiales bacterium GWF2_38_85]HBL84013.1 YicC family protein [Clostridiales bacterium]